MMFRLFTTNTDTFTDVGEGKRENGDIWYRKDLNEIRAFINGQVVVLFKSDGTPGNLPNQQG